MVTYEVTATVQPGLHEKYERYMRERHIADVLATGCFQRATLTRAEPGRYRMWYEAASHAAFDRYLNEHAPALRADFAAHFPEGVEVSREVWTEVQSWRAPTGATGRGDR